MKPVKLGIIGTGIAARDLHWPALQQLQDKFEITIVCNHTEPKAKAFSELVGNVPYVLDYRELLKSEDVEAVNIILPIHLNYQVTKETLEAGKHVIVEKPLAANLDEANKLLAIEKNFPQVKMVAENYRYRPGLLRIKELLSQDIIGKPYAFFWNFIGLLDSRNKYFHTQWRLNHQYRGGFITDGGVHHVAGIRMMFGDIINGNAFVKSINPDLGEADSFSFQMETTSGVHGILNIYISVKGYDENSIKILGEKGTLFSSDNILVIKNESREIHRESFQIDNGYKEEFEDFYLAIRENKMVVSTFTEAYRDLEIILNVLGSIKGRS